METLLFDLDGTLYPLDNGYHTHVVSPPPPEVNVSSNRIVASCGVVPPLSEGRRDGQ